MIETLGERFIEWVNSAERVLLITHEKPDGDGVASVLALRRAIERIGKTVTCVNHDPIPQSFRFLSGSADFKTGFIAGDYDLIAVLDCGDIRRTGFEEQLKNFSKSKRRVVNIDHHPKNDLHKVANLNLVDSQAAATAQILYRLFLGWRWTVDHEIATLLLCGLHTDTGGFKHPNTKPEVLTIAADLMARGGRLREISRRMTSERSVETLKLWGRALERLTHHPELGVVTSMITLRDLSEFGATHGDLAGVVNLINTIPGVKVSILFIEQSDGSIRASIRSDSAGVDVARLASVFGGGGMKKAGGFTISGKMLCGHDHACKINWDDSFATHDHQLDVHLDG